MFDHKNMEPTKEQINELLREVEAYTAFWAIANPLAASPRVEVNTRRMLRRIDQYGIRADLMEESR